MLQKIDLQELYGQPFTHQHLGEKKLLHVSKMH